MAEFMGYRRVDGTVGVRNHVVVMSSVSCANGVVEAIGREVPEVVAITHTEGCGRGPDDVTMAIRTLVGTASHPNVSATLLVGLGCEVIQATMLAARASEAGRRVEFLGIQDTGGTPRTVEAGVAVVRDMLAEASTQERERVCVELLMMAVECGWSDSMWGLTAYPAIGLVADWLVDCGGRVLMSEITEFIGAEDAAAARCATPEVRDRLMTMLAERHVNLTTAQVVLKQMVLTGKDPHEIVDAGHLQQVTDAVTIVGVVDRVLLENADIAADVKAGRVAKAQFLVGQVMKLSKGQADPAIVRELLANKLGITI